MKKEEHKNATQFGFTWSKADQTTRIIHPEEKRIKTVPEELIRELVPLTTSQCKAPEIPDAVEPALEKLSREGFFHDGPVIRLRPTDSSPSLWAYIALYVLALLFSVYTLLIALSEFGQFFAASTPEITALLGGIVLVLGFKLIHEFGHYLLATRHVPAVMEIGTINGIVPTFKTDTTYAWLVSKRERIKISIAGPLFELLVAAPLFVWFLVYARSSVAVQVFIIGVVLGQLLVMNPLYHGDGYLILEDVMGETGIKTNGLRHLRTATLSWYSVYAILSYGFAAAMMILSLVSVALVWNVYVAGATCVLVLGLIFVELSETDLGVLLRSTPDPFGSLESLQSIDQSVL